MKYTEGVSITKTNLFMSFQKRILASSGNNGQNTELLNVRGRGTYGNHCALKS
jgi:hypothetical protein